MSGQLRARLIHYNTNGSYATSIALAALFGAGRLWAVSSGRGSFTTTQMALMPHLSPSQLFSELDAFGRSAQGAAHSLQHKWLLCRAYYITVFLKSKCTDQVLIHSSFPKVCNSTENLFSNGYCVRLLPSDDTPPLQSGNSWDPQAQSIIKSVKTTLSRPKIHLSNDTRSPGLAILGIHKAGVSSKSRILQFSSPESAQVMILFSPI